ncbi:unnamed protein product [Onchocerca flexuosa]|uniref:Uncharacterized protein n=1 Tax=Onchocerca flexuosa TaxID=387005 RepID=A0A183I8M9_9BILA|nr:unnamed protein product [Onchocerca flexuosa]
MNFWYNFVLKHIIIELKIMLIKLGHYFLEQLIVSHLHRNYILLL